MRLSYTSRVLTEGHKGVAIDTLESALGKFPDYRDMIRPLIQKVSESTLPYHNGYHAIQVALFCNAIMQDDGYYYSPSLIVAALAHDIGYLPGFRYNEEYAASWLERFFLERKKPTPAYAKQLIQHTTISHHMRLESQPLSLQPYIDILLDADMCALACPFDIFLQVQSDVRSEDPSLTSLDKTSIEYTYAEDVLIAKQVDFFQHLQKQVSIYRTKGARDILEEAAQKNIATFIRAESADPLIMRHMTNE